MCYFWELEKLFWLVGGKVEIATESGCQLEPAAKLVSIISGSFETIYMSFAEQPLVFLQECRI